MAQKDLEDLGLSTRTAAALVGGGLTTVKKLESTSEDKLKGIKGLGPKALAEIAAALKQPAPAGKTEAETIAPAPTEDRVPEIGQTKAGKHSAKAKREAELKADKEAKKASQSGAEAGETPAVKRGPAPKTRPLSDRHGKKYRTAAKAIDQNKGYPLDQAIELAIQASTVKFDASVELHINLNVDPKQADQNIRENVTLPHGTGKTIRVAVFAPSEDHDQAKAAGADFVGESELIDKLTKEDIDFDVLVATPQLMSQLGRFAKLLGPKGLMPNPKSGTVTNNVVQAVKQAKAGRVEFRIDKEGIVHVAIGKVSFGPAKVITNAQTVLDAVKNAKPASVKVQYVHSIFATTSMGPSVRIEASVLSGAKSTT